MTISPEESVYIDRRKNCTKDEVVAKLIGWTQGPIRCRFTDDDVAVPDEDGFYTLDLASPVPLETIYSQEESLDIVLFGHLGLARDSFVAAVEGNASLAEIHEKKAAINVARERIENAKVYFRDIEKELAKGKGSILKIDQNARNAEWEPALTRESVKLWMRKKYKISLIDWEFAAGPQVPSQAGSKTGDSDQQKSTPRRKLRDQELAMLGEIQRLGYNPTQLPKRSPGKRGVKAEVKAALDGHPLFAAPSAFKRTWDELRFDRFIAEVQKVSSL